MIYNKNLLSAKKFEFEFNFDFTEGDFVTDVMVIYAILNWDYSKILVLHKIKIVLRD